MAITSVGSFVATNSKIAGTTLLFTSSIDIPSGGLAVLFVGTDNLTTLTASNNVLSVTDNAIVYNFAHGTGFNNTARTIVTQSDGKILVGGDFTTYNGSSVNRIVRFNTDGTLDTSFVASSEINGGVYKLTTLTDTGSYFVGNIWSLTNPSTSPRGCVIGIGTQNAALSAGSSGFSPTTEEYNGSTWANGGNLIRGRQNMSGTGTQNEGLVMGGSTGSVCNLTEEYNGTAWSAGGTLIVAKQFGGGAGTQNAGLTFGGNTPLLTACTEEYDGSIWTAGGNLITARGNSIGGAGTQNEAVFFGGSTPALSALTEEYDGTTWSTGCNLNTARNLLAGNGTQNTALAVGGVISGVPGVGCTEEYNGNTWTVGSPTNEWRFSLGIAGNSSAGLVFHGGNPGTTNTAEEYNPGIIGFCSIEKIITAFSGSSGRAISLCLDGTKDTFFNISSGFNGIACTVIVQPTNYTLNVGSWSNSTPLITRRTSAAGVGTQNEALVFGGASCTFPATTFLASAEEYNGTTWAAGGNLNNTRCSLAGAGTQNLGLAFGGVSSSNAISSCTEEYDGTAWTAGGTLILSRYALAGAGTQNAGLAFGGSINTPVTSSLCTEEYDGTAWIAGGNLINARYILAGAGTQNSALAIGGLPSSTEEYDGTAWTAGGTLNTGRGQLAGAGTQNEALAFGDNTSCTVGSTEAYDGTSWTVKYSLNNPRFGLSGAGTQNEALAAGGCFQCFTISVHSTTEEYNASVSNFNNKLIFGGTFTSYNNSASSGSVRVNGDGSIDTSFVVGAGFTGSADVRCYQFYNRSDIWSAGGALLNARNLLGGAGTQNEALAVGGDSVAFTEEYNGSTWAAGGALITARGWGKIAAGTQNAAVAAGGLDALLFDVPNTEEYNGSTWAGSNNLITSRSSHAVVGTQNAALAFAGVSSSTPGALCTEEYDGTSWTSTSGLLNDRSALAGAGTQNEGLAIAGSLLGTCTEEYNGTTWSAGGALIVNLGRPGATGTQNAALAFGGDTNLSCTEKYNGTSWSSTGALITGRTLLAGAGTQNEALAFGGSTPSLLACTEEFGTINGLLAVGNFTGYSGSIRNRIALLNPDNGTLIPTSSFNMGSAGFNANVNSIAIQDDNTIVAVGNFTAYSGSNINRIAKINTNGTLDTAFSASIGAGLNAEANVVVNYPSSSAVWIAGGSTSVGRSGIAGAGTQNAAVIFAGFSSLQCTEEYNGSSWSTGGIMIIGRRCPAGAGTQNAALAIAGFCGGPINLPTSCTEEYDGVSWTAGGTLNLNKHSPGAAGTQNAGLTFGGSPIISCTEEYDGTSWTSGGTLNSGRACLGGTGLQNEALAFGGVPTSSGVATEEYDGTSWTSGNSMIVCRPMLTGAGTQNATVAFGGFQNPITVSCTEEYNGTSWSTSTGLINTRCGHGGAGSQAAALAANGATFPAATSISCTEEYFSGPKLLLGGTFTSFAGSTYSGSARIFDDGNIDSSFAIGSGFGTAVDVEDFYIEPNANNGIIAIGGFTTYSASFSPQPNRIIKLNSNGSVDAASIGNTWIKLAERGTGDAAGAGGAVALFYLSTTSSIIYAGTSITASLSGSITAKAATGWVFNTTTSISPISGVFSSSAAGGTSDPPAMRLSGSNLTGSNNYLFIRGISLENDTFTFTPTANFSTMSAAGTTGGAVITNQSVRSEFRIITTSSLVSDPATSTATSNANIFYVFYENDAVAPVVSGRRTYFILID